MVSFELDEDERLILKSLEDFIEREVLPREKKLAHLLDSDRHYLDAEGRIVPEVREASDAIRKASAKLGFYGMHMPPEVGGAGISRTAMLKANQLVFSHGLGLTISVLANVEGPTRLKLHLDEAQRERWLAPCMAGEKTGAFALTEPGAGSDVRGMTTRAELDGDAYVLNGTKHFVSNAPYSDFVEVFAKTEPGSRAPYAISCFVVDQGTEGMTIGAPQDTISREGLQAEVRFDDCRIPVENRVGEEGEGFYLALENLNDLRLQIGGQAVGLATYCLDKAVDYATQREAFKQPISRFQGVSFQLAEAKLAALRSETLALYAAWLVDQGENPIMESSMVKLDSTEMLWKVADTCIQVHGGVGTTEEVGLERVLRYARVMRIFEGTSEIQKDTIAKMMGL